MNFQGGRKIKLQTLNDDDDDFIIVFFKLHLMINQSACTYILTNNRNRCCLIQPIGHLFILRHLVIALKQFKSKHNFLLKLQYGNLTFYTEKIINILLLLHKVNFLSISLGLDDLPE